MYKCKECGRIFSEPCSKREADTGYHEERCPHCGSERFDEAHECPICHTEYTTEDFCEDCYEEARYGLKELKKALGATQGDFEDIIANCFGW